MVEALQADAAQELLADGMHPGRAVHRAEAPDTARLGHPGDGWAERAVVVADQIGRMLPERRDFAQVLSDPGSGGMACDGSMDHPSRGQFHNDEGRELADEEIGDRQKVAGPVGGSVGAREGASGQT